MPPEAAEQIVHYVRVQREMMGIVPSQKDIVFERFFDESGGQQLVVHAPFGARINRAWGLALRKRFCVGFDFELQAAASDDAMLLSIGPNNSFPLEDDVRPRQASVGSGSRRAVAAHRQLADVAAPAGAGTPRAASPSSASATASECHRPSSA